MKKVGLLCGREWSWPPKFLEAVNGRRAGVTADYLKLGGTRSDEVLECAVVLDRVSHQVPYYRTYLKKAVLDGVAVVNNPFVWSADDKFFGAALCDKLGVARPKTIALPNKEYGPGIVKTESLRNLIYPLDWQAVVDQVGLPCILKDIHGGGWRGVFLCHSVEDLVRYYDGSGLMTMIAQEHIPWDRFVRCLCVGPDRVLVMPYDPHQRRYLPGGDDLPAAVRQRIEADSLKLVRAVGYEMDTVEWAVRDGVPYAIDFLNPAPDMDVNSMPPDAFEWAVSAAADLVIRLATHPRPPLTADVRWAKLV